MTDARRSAVALLLVTGTLLGLSTNLAKVAHTLGIAPLPFLMWSGGLAGVLLAVSAVAQGAKPHLTGRTVEYLACGGRPAQSLRTLLQACC
jgi:drug/metabolite transporter (DMT)-like permease